MSSDPPRLPPFPNELMAQDARQAALTFLLGLHLPRERARQLWARWCSYTGTRAERGDYRALELAAPDLEE